MPEAIERGARLGGESRSAPWAWPAAFCGYYTFHTFYRWLIGGGLGLDESQMFLWAQHLAWGYGPQPPLYSWLQWIAFQLIPDPLLALSAVKNALLCATCLCVYALLRRAHPPHRAGLATVGLLLLPQIAWESQRALSHSVLATSMAALTGLVFWTLTLPGRRWGYALFGVVAGLGLISKANYALVPAALLLAALSMPNLRRMLRLRGLALSSAIAALVAIGPMVWILQNREAALASTYKLRVADEAMPFPGAALDGLLATLEASALFLALPLVLAALIWWRCRDGSRPGSLPSLNRFLLRTALAGLLLTLAVVIATYTTEVKDRWMQPILFLGGPLIALWLLARVSDGGRRWYMRMAAICVALVVLILPVELVTGTPGNPARGGAPIEALASDITQAFPGAARIIADPEWVAANLAYRHPQWQAEAAHAATLAPGASALLVWVGEEDRGAELAARIGERSGSAARVGESVIVSAPHVWQPEIAFTLHVAPILCDE